MRFPRLRLLYSRRVVVATDPPIALEDRDFFLPPVQNCYDAFSQRHLLVLLAATVRKGGAHGYP